MKTARLYPTSAECKSNTLIKLNPYWISGITLPTKLSVNK